MVTSIFTYMVHSENIKTKGTCHRLVMMRIGRKARSRDRGYDDLGIPSAVALQLFAAQFPSSAHCAVTWDRSFASRNEAQSWQLTHRIWYMLFAWVVLTGVRASLCGDWNTCSSDEVRNVWLTKEKHEHKGSARTWRGREDWIIGVHAEKEVAKYLSAYFI